MAMLSPLTELPRELRDSIYHHAMFDEQPIYIKPSSDAAASEPSSETTKVISRSAIILTCKQLSAEYLEILPKVVKNTTVELEATVTNLEFNPLILALRELQQNPIEATATKRSLLVKLTIDDELMGVGGRRTIAGPLDSLKEWCAYADETGIIARYKIARPKCEDRQRWKYLLEGLNMVMSLHLLQLSISGNQILTEMNSVMEAINSLQLAEISGGE